MARTGQQLLVGFSTFIDDLFTGATTSAGSTTTVVDTTLSRFGDDTLQNRFFRITEASHGAIYQVRICTTNTESTGTATVSPAYGTTTGTSMDYEVHKWEPRKKFEALDAAIIALADKLPQVVYNETITLDGKSTEFNIPSNIRRGPVVVQIEQPIEATAPWNFVQDPQGDSLTNWTTSNVTASLYTVDDGDLLIPKYDESCTRLVVAGITAATYTQPVASMTNGVTAAAAAGRRMTFGAWVYSRTANKIAIDITDDSATTTSAQHGGSGWELLTVTADIDSANATTLTVGFTIDNDASAFNGFWNRAWLMYADQLPSHYNPNETFTFRVRRDDTTQRIILPARLRGKRQLRIIGVQPLSTLGSTISTQVTNSVEVDVNSAEFLYAKAAQILFGKDLYDTEAMSRTLVRVQVAEARLNELERLWAYDLGTTPQLRGPYDY